MLRLILDMLNLPAGGTCKCSFVVGNGLYKSSTLEFNLELKDLEARNRF